MRSFFLALPLLTACAVDLVDEDVAQGGRGDDQAPLIGVSGVGDFADRSCQIVLRDFGRVGSGSGFAVNGSRWIFEGRVDVKKTALAEGAVPMLLVKSGSDPGWRALPAIASTGISGDDDRFLFHLDDGDLPGPGISATGLARSTVQVIPFLAKDQSRLFDHNRIVDAFATYVMNQRSNFAIADDNGVCNETPGPTLTFAADFSISAGGPVVGGRSVVVNYDIARLPRCRQTYNGAPTWSVMANATFLPMNVRQSASVVDHTTQPSSSTPATFFAPEGATEMVLYFQNNDRASCSDYDSNFGNNFHFAVADQGPEWMGNVAVSLSRGGSRRCDGAVAFGSQVSYGSWARQRAAITDLCFEVYEPGLTDDDGTWARGDLWQKLDVTVHHRFGNSGAFATDYVAVANHTGNNAQYAVDLRAFDPFVWGKCLNGIPTTTVAQPDGDHLQATLEVYFTVNGEDLRPEGRDAFRVVFDDAANSPRVTCP